MESDKVKVGPFSFSFFPDGDDPGVGAVQIEAGDYPFAPSAITSFTVDRMDWDAFVKLEKRVNEGDD